MTARSIIGDCRLVLPMWSDRTMHACITSPPYWGLRDYGVAGQIGLEPTPEAYVDELVRVFREVRRVLRDDGTLWLNLGDCYTGSGKGGKPDTGKQSTNRGSQSVGTLYPTGGTAREAAVTNVSRRLTRDLGLPPKNLVGIPWRVALALQADGWYLRSDIIWSKPNPMPESVTDRPTKAHEYLFLFAKSERYYYDAEAIKEPIASGPSDIKKMIEGKDRIGGKHLLDDAPLHAASSKTSLGRKRSVGSPDGRNKRSVWEIDDDEFDQFLQWKAEREADRPDVWPIATAPFAGAHFATFPPALVEPCILAGTSPAVCEACGAPRIRIVERTAMQIRRSERTHEKGHTRSSGMMTAPPTSRTVGWRAGCRCQDAADAPAMVFDPFGGAGTVGLVADRLGRNATLVELNADYAAMGKTRYEEDAPLFNRETSLNGDRTT